MVATRTCRLVTLGCKVNQYEAHLWSEADSAFVALDNPKHRFLAPAFERDLLLRFFPDGNWRQAPSWTGFGRYRSLAICFELLGQNEDALAVYRESDSPLRGDALLSLGRLQPLLDRSQVDHPWQVLWQAYRAHALCLAGRDREAVALTRALVPVDVYEWVHIFECLLRAGQLRTMDLQSMLFRPPHSIEHRWSELARRRMRADYLRLTAATEAAGLDREYTEIVEAYDRGGLPYERTLARLSMARLNMKMERAGTARKINRVAVELATRHDLRIVAADAWEIEAEIALCMGESTFQQKATAEAARLRIETGYRGPSRP